MLFFPTPRPVFNTYKSKRSFFPIQQCRSSWWSLIKPFLEHIHHLGHGLSRVLSLLHPHTCHQPLLNRATACVSHTENTTTFWFCDCGKTCVHYFAHCCQTTILHCTAFCAVLCKHIESEVRIVWVYGDFSPILYRKLIESSYLFQKIKIHQCF